MKVLVLGGNGFLGSHLVDQVVEMGHDVTVFDHFSGNGSKNLAHQQGRIRFIRGEFSDPVTLRTALEGQDIVYYFICATNPIGSWEDPVAEVYRNLLPSLQLCRLAQQEGNKKIVFPSSGGTVYGIQDGPVDESFVPKPFAPHGIIKLAVEHYLNYYRVHFGINVDIFRIANVYGPRQPANRAQGVIAVWMDKILRGVGIEVYGDRRTLRDYVYVKDVAFLMTHSLRNLNESDLYNLGTGHGTSVLELLDIFRATIGNTIKYTVFPRRPSDNISAVLDSSKLLAAFPGFDLGRLEDKIPETWDYLRKTLEK